MATTPRIPRSRVALAIVVAGVAALLALVVAPSLVSPAQASTPWGACGIRTPEDKVVTKYYATPRAYYYLRCGTAEYGYRHILNRHRGDFERLAFGTDQNWRDIADLSMDAISRDPDAAKPGGNGKGCLSRVIFLRNKRTNQVVRQQTVRMYFRYRDNAIITVHPRGTQCP